MLYVACTVAIVIIVKQSKYYAREDSYQEERYVTVCVMIPHSVQEAAFMVRWMGTLRVPCSSIFGSKILVLKHKIDWNVELVTVVGTCSSPLKKRDPAFGGN